MHELNALNLPVASEAAALLWDMNLQLRRQAARIRYLEMIGQSYREEIAEMLAKLDKVQR